MDEFEGVKLPSNTVKVLKKLASASYYNKNIGVSQHTERKTLQVGDITFKSYKPLFQMFMKDYICISNVDLENYKSNLPESIKDKLKHRWLYSVSASSKEEEDLRITDLQYRVKGGQILAYKHFPFSINDSPCVYYGFIPSYKQNLSSVHSECRFSLTAHWPREIYIYLENRGACFVHSDCLLIGYKNYDRSKLDELWHTSEKTILLGAYFFMGNTVDDQEIFKPKEQRTCQVCAQCEKCALLVEWCRSHKVCKHKIKIDENQSFAKLDISPNIVLKEFK
jgi:hypothetical protein